MASRLNGGYEYRERLGRGADAETLIGYLSRRYPHSSESDWLARIAERLVLLDGEPSAPDAALRSGQTLTWRRPPWAEPDAPRAFAVLHDDADLLAVAKPSGLPTLPGADFLEATLLHQVRRRFPDAAPLHRLGRWTSGVVLFARGASARAGLSRRFAAREIGKRYRALASGVPPGDHFDVTAPIGEVPHAWLGSVHAAAADGRPSSSRVVVLERREGAFVCDVFIETGRAHQIRIHLAAAGCPLVGDPLYVAGGAPAAGSTAVPGDPGYLLHAAEVTLRHPRDGRPLAIACAPPAALRVAGR